MRKDTLKKLLDARAQRRAMVLVTPLAGGDEEIIGEETPGNNHPLAEEIADCFRTGRSKTVAREDGEVFLHAVLPAPRLMIVGATHIAQTLVRLAREVGVEPIVIDPRTAFATQQRFTESDIITKWPEEALGELKLDARSALVCLAHVPDIDDEALRAALRSDCFYIGALGSRRSHAKRVARLHALGVSEEETSVIHAPVGLDIGSVSPGEIALSIIAEVVKVMRARNGD